MKIVNNKKTQKLWLINLGNESLLLISSNISYIENRLSDNVRLHRASFPYINVIAVLPLSRLYDYHYCLANRIHYI